MDERASRRRAWVAAYTSGDLVCLCNETHTWGEIDSLLRGAGASYGTHDAVEINAYQRAAGCTGGYQGACAGAPSPTPCAGGQVRQADGSCACASGQVWTGTQCVARDEPPPGDSPACATARQVLTHLESRWQSATCEAIADQIAGDCSLFPGDDDPVRAALAPGTCRNVAYTFVEACGLARAQLAAADFNWWSVPCQALADEVAGNCSIFVGPANPIRHALAPGSCGALPIGGVPSWALGLAAGVVGLAVAAALAARPRPATVQVRGE